MLALIKRISSPKSFIARIIALAVLGSMSGILVLANELADASVTIADHNISGNVKWSGGTGAWNLVNQNITSDTWVITAQEVCYDQYVWERNQVRFFYGTIWHGSFRSQLYKKGICGKGSGSYSQFGSVVLGKSVTPAAGTPDFPSNQIIQGNFAHQVPADENRGWNCAKLSGFGIYLACTAHMSSSNSIPAGQSRPYRILQTEQFRVLAVLGALSGDYTRVWWTGDFYTYPSEMLVIDPALTT